MSWEDFDIKIKGYYENVPYSKKLWRSKFGEKGYCKALAEKVAKKHVLFLYNQLEISAALPFRQVSKCIANETDFSLSRNYPRNKHRCSDSVLPLMG